MSPDGGVRVAVRRWRAVFGESLAARFHRLETPTNAEPELALQLGRRYSEEEMPLP